MPDLVIPTSDAPVTPEQYRYVAVDAWWLGSFGPFQHLTEHRLRQWVPVQPERDWLLERSLTGRQKWLTGSLEEAADLGFAPEGVAPVGIFRAPWGEFHKESDDDCLPPAQRRRGSWQVPTPEFFTRLPRDVDAMVTRLLDDHPGRWTQPFSSAVDALRTCTVPADLRRVLYGALVKLPDVTWHDDVEIDGRACVTIVHEGSRTRTELHVDAVDGQFAGERDTVRPGNRLGLASGTLIAETTVHCAVVDDLGLLPGY